MHLNGASSGSSFLLPAGTRKDGPHSIITMAALGLGLRLSQDVAEACRKRERQATGDASLAARSFVSCATVTTQRMRDGRTSSQQHGRPSVSALTSTYLVCSFPMRHQPLGSTEEDRLPYIALIIAWCFVIVRAAPMWNGYYSASLSGCCNMKSFLLCKIITVLEGMDLPLH